MSDASPARVAHDAWEALLDAMEEGLNSFPPVLPETLPADPGSVPPDLADRARRTLHRMAEVEATLDQRRAELGRKLAALAAARNAADTAASKVPHFLDTKA